MPLTLLSRIRNVLPSSAVTLFMESKRLAILAGPVFVCLLLVSGVAYTLRSQDPPRPEQPSWLVRGAVLRAHPDGGCEDCRSWLVLTRGLASKKIENMNDFRGFVEIKTAKDALSYCRFGDNDPKYPHSGAVQHTELDHGETREAANAWGHTVSNPAWNAAGMSEPRVTKLRDSWVVTRSAIVTEGRVVKPYLIEETVGKDGSYSLKKLKTFKLKMGKNDSLYFDMLG